MTLQQIQYIKQLLRNVAEVDPEDRIANCASQLAVDLEQNNRIHELTDAEQQLIRYAYQKRNTYVLLPGAKHAKRITTAQLTCTN